MTSVERLIIDACGKWVEEHVEDGWEAFIITFMFHHLPGSTPSKLAQMRREVDRIYALTLTRFVRNPRSKTQAGRLPIWIVPPDYPVAKREKKTLRDVTLNDGLHMQGIALTPPMRRRGQRLDHDLKDNQRRYLGHGSSLRSVRADIIKIDPGYVTDYVLKSLKRKRLSMNDLIILPKSRTEMVRSRREACNGHEVHRG
jgi:hypothetical protein